MAEKKYTKMNELKPILEKDSMVAKFATIYSSIHGVDYKHAENMCEAERFNFLSQITAMDKPLDQVSTIGVFLEVISNGLSFNSSQKHVYLIPRGQTLTYNITADGMIFLAQKANTIKDVTIPQIVYEGEDCTVKVVDNQTIVNHTISLTRAPDSKIVAGYCFVIHNDNSKEFVMLNMEDVDRLKGYSTKQNRGSANALYTSNKGQIDVGFFKTKIIKTALKNVRKISGSISRENEVNDDGLLPQEFESI